MACSSYCCPSEFLRILTELLHVETVELYKYLPFVRCRVTLVIFSGNKDIGRWGGRTCRGIQKARISKEGSRKPLFMEEEMRTNHKRDNPANHKCRRRRQPRAPMFRPRPSYNGSGKVKEGERRERDGTRRGRGRGGRREWERRRRGMGEGKTEMEVKTERKRERECCCC